MAWTATGNTDDYSPASGTVTFAANSAAGATQSITITTTDDLLSETAESFTVTLGYDHVDAVLSGLAQERSILRHGDDIRERPDHHIDLGSHERGRGRRHLHLHGVFVTVGRDSDGRPDRLLRDEPTARRRPVRTTRAKSGTLTFTNAAAGSQTFTVQTTEDTFDESGETFTVTISSPSGGGGTTSLGTSSVVTTTIDDDDDAISGITLTVSPTGVGEDDAKTEFTVTASLGGTTTRPSDTVVTLTLGGTAGSPRTTR